MSGPSRFVSLLKLSEQWADQGGYPPPLVLGRICGWAVAGAFPEGSFIKASGERIEPFDLYMSFRAVTAGSELGGTVNLGGVIWPASPFRWSGQVFTQTLVSKDAITNYCDLNNIVAPPCIGRKFSIWRRIRTKPALLPPDCGHAEAAAIKHDALNTATGALRGLEDLIDCAQGKPVYRPRFYREKGEPLDLECVQPMWDAQFGFARENVERSESAHLRAQLDALMIKWEKIIREASEDVAAPKGEASGIIENRRGRPPGSGSYEDADVIIVEKMRQAVQQQRITPTAAANLFADEAVGAGTRESKAKRLAKRYSEMYSSQAQTSAGIL